MEISIQGNIPVGNRMDKIPCLDCADFQTCEAMKLLESAIAMGIDKQITSINCPKYRIEIELASER